MGGGRKQRRSMKVIVLLTVAVSWVTCAKGGNARGTRWPGANTSEGVHLFTLWSQEARGDLASFDFVWSIENEADLKKYRAAGALRKTPAVLSRYVPFGIVPSGHGEANENFSNLSWWQKHHPEWILYRCDRRTPATYWGPGLGLDISNPDVLQATCDTKGCLRFLSGLLCVP